MNFFKWIFPVLGFLQRGPVFFRCWYALVGWWIGSWLDNLLAGWFGKAKSTARSSGSRYHAGGGDLTHQLLEAVMTLFAHVVHADGRVMHSEMESVRSFLRANYPPALQTEGERIILSLFAQKKAMPPQEWERMLALSCQLLSAHTDYLMRLTLMRVLVSIAKADGMVGCAERQALQLIAAYLGMSEGMVDQFLSGADSSSRSWQRPQDSASRLVHAYRTLGLKPTATKSEVKKAYRHLAMKYHPDKVAKDPASQREAASRFNQITVARDLILSAKTEE